MNVAVEQIKRELWLRGDLSYKLDAHQLEIAEYLKTTTADEILFFCARQFGKSFLNLITAIEFAIRHPNSIVRIAAPTLKQAADIVNDNLNIIIQDAPVGLIARAKSEYRYNFSNGSSLRLGALERANVDSLRGGNAKLIIAEEGGFVSSEDYKYAMSSVIGPQLLRSGGQLIHVTTPSEEPEHHIHTEILPKCELTNTVIWRNIYDNKALTPEKIAKAMKLCGGEQTEAWQREYLVKIIRSLNLVCVPEWSDEYVQDFEMPRYATTLTTMDTGGVQDKTVALVLFHDFTTGIDHYIDERAFDSNTDSASYIAEIKEMETEYPQINYRYADAPGQLLIDLRTNHDYQAYLPNKDDWQASLNDFRVRVGQGKVKVHPRCKMLIATLRGATFNKARTDFARTKALGHCDALAAALYGNRMLDRARNPYPIRTLNPEFEWQRPDRREQDSFTQVSGVLNPWRAKQRNLK